MNDTDPTTEDKRPLQLNRRRRGRGFLAAALLASMFVASSLVTTGASAKGTTLHSSGCRTDPVVTLSNGASADLHEAINDSATDVKSISYQLVLPAGVSVKSVTYSGDVAGSLQSLTWTSTNKAGAYDEYVTVTTGTKNTLTAYASVSSVLSRQVSGMTNSALHIQVQV